MGKSRPWGLSPETSQPGPAGRKRCPAVANETPSSPCSTCLAWRFRQRKERGLSQAAMVSPMRAAWKVPGRPLPAHTLRSGTLRGPQKERGVYAASAWDNPKDPAKFLGGGPALRGKRPAGPPQQGCCGGWKGRAPATIGAGRQTHTPRNGEESQGEKVHFFEQPLSMNRPTPNPSQEGNRH